MPWLIKRACSGSRRAQNRYSSVVEFAVRSCLLIRILVDLDLVVLVLHRSSRVNYGLRYLSMGGEEASNNFVGSSRRVWRRMDLSESEGSGFTTKRRTCLTTGFLERRHSHLSYLLYTWHRNRTLAVSTVNKSDVKWDFLLIVSLTKLVVRLTETCDRTNIA